MKRILFLGVCILIVALSSCADNAGHPATGNLDAVEFSLVSELDPYTDCSVLLYGSDKIYLYKISDGTEQDNAVFTLYEMDMTSHEIRPAGTIDHFYMCVDSVVPLKDGIAFTVCTREGEALVNSLYLYRDGALSESCSWDSEIPMSYISKISEEEVALFYPRPMVKGNTEYYIYEIVRVHLADGTKKELAEFQYNITEQEGEIVPSVDFEDGILYLFKSTAQGLEKSYSICSIDLEGRTIAEYSIDLDDFLYLEAVSDYDSVYRIRCPHSRFYVLQTLNSRIIVFEKSGDGLVRADAPECLSAFPEGYKIADYCDDNFGEIYFVNMFSDHLIKFDGRSGEFTELSIEKADEESYIRSVDLNQEGSILIGMDGQFYIREENR